LLNVFNLHIKYRKPNIYVILINISFFIINKKGLQLLAAPFQINND